MKIKYVSAVVILLLAMFKTNAQGPPITADKPIMLGGGAVILKTLTEIRGTNRGTFVYAPVMAHYLPTSNSLVAVHVPFVSYDFRGDNPLGSGTTYGDMGIMLKYQFHRKDGTGKTFRMVAKSYQTLPTGKKLDIRDMSTGKYQGYYGVVAGYESLKFGISNELGYNMVPDGDFDELRYKLGFGLPLLKPTYPVNQLNLYFEYTNNFRFSTAEDEYDLFYAQGIQYARKQFTWELAVQLPLIQNNVPELEKRNYSVFLGTRYVF